MAAQMLAVYYSKGCLSDTLFQNLEISTSLSYKKHLNKYDVIFIEMRQILIESGDIGNFINYLQ